MCCQREPSMAQWQLQDGRPTSSSGTAQSAVSVPRVVSTAVMPSWCRTSQVAAKLLRCWRFFSSVPAENWHDEATRFLSNSILTSRCHQRCCDKNWDSASKLRLRRSGKQHVQLSRTWSMRSYKSCAAVFVLEASTEDSYQPFDPARRRWVGSWPLPDKEERFARQFLRAASLAGFTPLSRFDLEKTRELKADLLSLPVTINWDRLDSRWIETLLKGAGEEGAEAVPEALSDFGGYVLALKRGLAVERHSGRLLMQKLECLQSQWLLRVGSLLQSLLRGVSRLSVKAWRTVLPAARGWAESRHGEALRRKLRRVKAAGARGVSFAKLLRETWRGVRMRISGMQVLRRLQPSSYRYAQWLFGDVLNERWSTERAALIKRLANAWEQEVALRGQLQSHLPVSAEVRKAAKEQGNFLERVAIEHLSFNWATLLQHAELQEPQFQEILVAYRLKGDTPSDYQPPPRRQICVRRFFEVNMKDIKLVLPQEAWRMRGRPLDMIRADLITMVGLFGVSSHVLANTNKWLAVVPVVLLSVRTIANYRRVKVGSKSRVDSMLFDHCLDKDAALMRLLPDAAEAQVFSECALAYWSLLVGAAERSRHRSVVVVVSSAPEVDRKRRRQSSNIRQTMSVYVLFSL
ncbi:Uncharacterized protein SCF082_LOCUS26179 [Durusdinium trenchii]|uniref:Uncharacterized protein n=1 Tax=Durusdinium trenchii TaxID=1381693 RepID=A0ABP0M4W1_9DINO